MKNSGRSMNKGYKIKWTKEAEQNVDDIIQYLTDFWSKREVNNFLMLLRKRVELISKNPEMFKIVEGTDFTRVSVMTKQNSIFYEFKNETIEILYVFDTRQNPDKLNI